MSSVLRNCNTPIIFISLSSLLLLLLLYEVFFFIFYVRSRTWRLRKIRFRDKIGVNPSPNNPTFEPTVYSEVFLSYEVILYNVVLRVYYKNNVWLLRKITVNF
jgi:hypothetical protein